MSCRTAAGKQAGRLTDSLPILTQPEYIWSALSAGKHVLSEKPIAKDAFTGEQLIRWYTESGACEGAKWAVGENIRYVNKYGFVADEVRRLGGARPFRVNVCSLIGEGSKYYSTSLTIWRRDDDRLTTGKETEWRKTPEYQGGFILDGGIHIIAALRMILGSGMDELEMISAQTCLLQPHLAPLDTVDAVFQTKKGATGVLSLSYGSPFSDSTFEFVCEKGSVSMHGDRVTVNGESRDIPFEGRGVDAEVAEFAEAIVKGTPVGQRQSPQEALADLKVVQEMLASAKSRE